MDMRVERKARFLFYLTPEFTMLAFTSALEALRLANKVLDRDFYEWRLISEDGRPALASCGLPINADLSLAQAKDLVSKADRPRMIVVCSGRNVQLHRSRALENWLRSCRARGIALGAVCTGAHHLGRAGLLRDKRCTIHWENFPSFGEEFPDAHPTPQIYEVDDGIYTCAGGIAALEMMLHIVGTDFGFKVASVCELAIVASVRDKSERQRPFSLTQGVKNPALRRAIYAMEENLTDTVCLSDL
jgi:transcriptional regulator GlxA family with amidase domain